MVARELQRIIRAGRAATLKITPIQSLIEGISEHITRAEKDLWMELQTHNLSSNIEDLYSLQNGLIALDTVLKQITEIHSQIKQNYEEELQKKVDAGEFEHDEHVIVPIMKRTNRSVDEDILKEYYKPFFDKIIEAKTAILEKTYKISVKDVETFMGSLAEKVIRPGAEAIAGYEIQRKE